MIYAGVIGDDFSPDDLSGLVLWLNPASITGKSDGDTVTSWLDSSGNSNDASEATNPPTYADGTDTYENLPGVRFDAVAEKLTVASSATLSNLQATWIIIARLEGVDVDPAGDESIGTCWLFNKRNTNPSTISLRLDPDGYEAFYRKEGAEGTAVSMVNDAMVDQSISLHCIRASGSRIVYDVSTSAGDRETVQEDTGTGMEFDDDNNNTLTIGNHPTVNNSTNVDRVVYDVIVYNNYKTDAELDQIVTWFRNRYSSKWVKQGQLFGSNQYGAVNIFIDGSTAYLTYTSWSDGVSIGYMTADVSDPHNWTDQGTIFTTANQCRTARLVKSGSTWYLYYDDRVNGQLRVATGAAPGSLTDYGSNPILSGSGTGWEQFVRHPFVLTPAESHDSNWQMLYDGRQGLVTSGVGAIGHATSSDGLTWTRDTANNPILSASGAADWEGNDVGEPRARWNGSEYEFFYTGYFEDWNAPGVRTFPHWLGEGTSASLTSVTRATGNPILPLSQDDADFDCISHVSPCPYVPGDGEFYLYFCGFDTGPNYFTGYAKKRLGA